MASITYDGRTFSYNGKRIWIVGGTIPYASCPREQWADRIHAAKLAGLNTIATPVVWSLHEPMPGKFDFDGDRDLRHFVKLIGEAGMYCILRPGPFVGEGWDLGGLPVWLADVPELQYRAKNAPFLDACSRYYSALAGQLKDLQVTSPGEGGPILLVQNEWEWTCGDDTAALYLSELDRFKRESGLTVPVINDNYLWTSVEGEIDAWSGGDDMLSMMRQLGSAKGTLPRLVVDAFAGTMADEDPPVALTRALVEMLAGGAQFNMTPFFEGVRSGLVDARSDSSVVPSAGPVMIDDAGAPTPMYHAARRVSQFASRFGTVLSNLENDQPSVMLDPRPEAGRRASGRVSLCHRRGTHGSVVFLFADPVASTKRGAARDPIALLLPDGSELEVDLGDQPAGWVVLNAHLHGRCKLDYCGLAAIGSAGRTFLCSGPAGSVGHLSLNGSPLSVEVPAGNTPAIIEHEGTSVVVVNDTLMASAFVTDDGVFTGVSGVSRDGTPQGLEKHAVRIDPEGNVHEIGSGAKRSRGPQHPTIQAWESGDHSEHVLGTSARYAIIDGPERLPRLGTPHGFGWYRIALRSTAAKKHKIAAPESGDRLLFLLDGEPVGVIGDGPGAVDQLTLSLKKGDQTLVVLADNLGHAPDATVFAEPKGLCGHLWDIAPIKMGKPELSDEAPIELLSVRSPLGEAGPGDATAPKRLSWSLTHRKKSPLVFQLDALPVRCVVLFNDEPIAVVDAGHRYRLFADDERLFRGKNTLSLAPVIDAETDEDVDDTAAALVRELAPALTVTECVGNLTAKSEWAFAKWEQPAPAAFEAAAKTKLGSSTSPGWWRAEFDAPSTPVPLFADLSGMTKGQLYLNGRHVTRYFVQTAEGEPVSSDTRFVLPQPWLKDGEPNELVLFDEHGGNPGKVKLVYDAKVRPITV